MAPKTKKGQSSQKGNTNSGFKTKKVGEYASPSTKLTMTRSVMPKLQSTERGVVVSNTETLGNIYIPASSTAWSVVVPINPVLFPWGKTVAKNYSRYRILSAKLSYVPQCPTTSSGVVDMGLFYDFEDAQTWITTGSDTLTACGDFASGPPYAGGAICSSGSNLHDDNWFGLVVDTKRAHRSYPWLIIDPSHTASEGNQKNAATLGVRIAGEVIATDRYYGRLFLSYSIEFIDPVSPTVQ